MKKCPVCKNSSLIEIQLEEGLPAERCEECQGTWLSSTRYLSWLRLHGPDLPEKESANSAPPIWDSQAIKICPDCGRIMSRYRVLPGIDLNLDRCGNCNGVWFDRDEWVILVDRNLHDNLNSFFTRPWQAQVHAEDTRRFLDKMYLEKFGEQDYARLKEFRGWLKDHPQRSMLLAYLQADDPYKI